MERAPYVEEQECPEKTSERSEGVKYYKKTLKLQSILMFSLIHVLRFVLNETSFSKFLILGGTWFQVLADLTMKELFVTDFSTLGTNSVPSAALLVSLLLIAGFRLL